MIFYAIIGEIVVGLVLLAIGLLLLSMAWSYVQAAGGYIRAKKIAARHGVTLWKQGKPKPRFFFVRMVHWQAWHSRNWEFGGVEVPWTFREPIKRAERWYPA